MFPSDDSQSFLSFYERSPPRSRQLSGTAASIWAPQPLSSETAWPVTLESFTRTTEKEVQPASLANVQQKSSSLIHEDVFGGIGINGKTSPKTVGAIGEGRKMSTPSFDDTHIEQLLRTLNLNSPAPYHQQPPLSLNFDFSPTSPDFSPMSTSSSLLTPTDLSPSRSLDLKLGPTYDSGPPTANLSQSSIFEPSSPNRPHDILSSSDSPPYHRPSFHQPAPNLFPFFEPFSERPSRAAADQPVYSSPQPPRRLDSNGCSQLWRRQQPLPTPSEWLRSVDDQSMDHKSGLHSVENSLRQSLAYQGQNSSHTHEPINFLSLLHPSSSPPYHVFVARIIKSSDQQASIFLQQKLKVADIEERAKIVDAICARGFEMMAHRFGNWAVQRCLEAAATPEERRKIVSCMRGRIVELATNCYGCHVLQKALDCEEDIRLLIVSELLLGDPAQTLVNKHASHVWSKIMELTWTPPAPPIFAYVNKSLKGKWAALACHETGSLVVQHAFENLEDSAKDGIVDELLNQGADVFGEVAKSQWGSYCIQHILEHGSETHRQMTLNHLITGLLEYASNEQGAKSVTKALKEGGKDTLNKVIKRMCEPAKGARRAMIVDLALSVTGSQLIASVLPAADKDQRSTLYECIRGHIVTLRGCKTGSKVIWLFDRMRAYYGY